MPYDTNGNYSLPAIYYAISGTTINPSQHNTPLEDVQAALNRTLLRDGSAPMTGPLNANGNKITGLADGTANGDVVTYGQLQKYLSLSATTLQTVSGPVAVKGTLYTSSNSQTGALFYGGAVGSRIDGYLINNPAVPSTSGQTYLFDSWMEVNPGVSTYGVIRAWTWQGERRWTFGEDGGITSSAKGGVAWQSDIATLQTALAGKQNSGDYATNSALSSGLSGKQNTGDYATNTALQNGLAGKQDSGDYALLSQLPLDPSKIILAWSGYVGGGDQSIPYPRGVSSVDTVVVACSRQVSGNKATAVINVQGWDNSSVQVNTVWVAGAAQENADTNFRAILIGNK